MQMEDIATQEMRVADRKKNDAEEKVKLQTKRVQAMQATKSQSVLTPHQKLDQGNGQELAAKAKERIKNQKKQDLRELGLDSEIDLGLNF